MQNLLMRYLILFAAFLLCKFSNAQDTISKKSFFVRTNSSNSFLEYGTGDDRLGGAKIGYLDSNVLLKVVDSFKTDYIVRLSKYHTAYIDKSTVKNVSSNFIEKPQYLTTSWRLTGNDTSDYLAIGLDEKLSYRSFQQINPSRIVVDIYGVYSNTNWITQLTKAKEVRNVWYEQVEDDVMRIFIELRHKQHWGHSISYSGNRLTVRIKRQPVDLSIKKLRIAIDAGHGGDNSGASGVTSKILEKNYTLLFAKQLQALLQKRNVEVLMTRQIDTPLSMTERIEMLKKLDPDLLISIHLNSAGNDSVKGVSTYYRHIGFRPLSTAILGKMLDLKLNEYGNIGAFNFSLSGPTDYPNCLVEVAFLSNREDEKRIMQPQFHKDVALQIYKGILEWLKQVQKQEMN